MKPITIQSDKHSASEASLHRFLILCGVLSSLLYVIMNVVAAMLYTGYNSITQTVSELSAIGAPTRTLWVSLGFVYSLLIVGFGYGVLQSSLENRNVRIVGILLITSGIVGFFWPPMHQRQVIADGGATLTDTLHIVFTFVAVPLMIAQIVFGMRAMGNRFMQFSIISLAIMVTAGILTAIESPNISSNSPTPLIGIWERINIGIYMLWVATFAMTLQRAEKKLISEN